MSRCNLPWICNSKRFLTHCILNRFSQTIYWKSPILVLGMSCYQIYIFLEKIAKIFAKSGDPDQTQLSAVSDLGLHCLPITLLRDFRLQWVKKSSFDRLLALGSLK